MRIPLDYYRILGLPIQATAEQLQQAHRDRIQQLPRREFSETAIEARKQLIDEAYAVLSNPAQRQDYDASFLARSYELLEVGRTSDFRFGEDSLSTEQDRPDPDLGIDSYTPSIEIDELQFVGALLILLELGEYELVLKLGRPYLSGGNLNLKNGDFGDADIAAADIVLTVALACLELGREQWQQGQYENAAESLETGQDLLLREALFANIRGEMQSDLFKLRPYRILELLALPMSQAETRQQGLALLQDMLHDRGGIDGVGDDQSGLSVDDFLRFIQQLRSYLSAAEQQSLFEAEARRPSAVATYLAVYALLARGFAQRQPALIRRAKSMLIRLGTRQDVHLEQAVCALLLGQTEEASRALELSQEFESLAFIREHSQGSPDLLPGLCLYSERWLQNEVFPHFRDLARKQASLKEYFADEDVQTYLEELPNEAEPGYPQTAPQPAAAYRQPLFRREAGSLSEEPPSGQSRQRPAAAPTAVIMDGSDYSINGTAVPSAERVGQTRTEGRSNGFRAGSGQASRPDPVRSSPRSPERARGQGAAPAAGLGLPRKLSRSLRLDRVVLLAAVGLLGLVVVGFLVSRLFGDRPQSTPRATNALQSPGAAQSVKSLQPAIASIAETAASAAIPTGPLTQANAPALVQAWLSAKAAALGEEHDLAKLDTILVDPALSQQRARAEAMETGNSYWQYEHSNVQVSAVETNPDTPDQAQIEASITEKGELYTNGSLDQGSSYSSEVRVRYELVRENEQWRIRDWQVLE